MFQDLSNIIDKGQVGLMLISVGLFLTSLAVQWATNRKGSEIDEKLKIQNDNNAAMKKAVDDTLALLQRFEKEHHEQWGKINTTQQLETENNMRIKDLGDTMDSISEQQTVLATAQLNQTQSTQKVIDALVDALSEHQRESRD